MSRSWSSAHDWKSCKGQKLFESSNLSISAKNKSLPFGRFLFLSAGWRDSNQNRTSQRDVHLPVRTLADTSVFPRGKNANVYSPSPPEKSTCLGKCFFQRNPPFGWVKYPADVKSSLRSGDIAAAVGGFHFTFRNSGKFHKRQRRLFHILRQQNISRQP